MPDELDAILRKSIVDHYVSHLQRTLSESSKPLIPAVFSTFLRQINLIREGFDYIGTVNSESLEDAIQKAQNIGSSQGLRETKVVPHISFNLIENRDYFISDKMFDVYGK